MSCGSMEKKEEARSMKRADVLKKGGKFGDGKGADLQGRKKRLRKKKKKISPRDKFR